MATGTTGAPYNFPYPVLTDPVNVHGDLKALAEAIALEFGTFNTTYVSISVRNNSGSSITKGDPVYITGYDSGTSKVTIAKSVSTDIETFPVVGLAAGTMGNNSSGTVITSGIFSDINTGSFSSGDVLYVGTTGGLTATQPATGSGAVGIVIKSATAGSISVGQPKGNGTWGALKAGLA